MLDLPGKKEAGGRILQFDDVGLTSQMWSPDLDSAKKKKKSFPSTCYTLLPGLVWLGGLLPAPFILPSQGSP